jgi:hypothetical protein
MLFKDIFAGQTLEKLIEFLHGVSGIEELFDLTCKTGVDNQGFAFFLILHD